MSSEFCIGIEFLYLFSFYLFIYFLEFFKNKRPFQLQIWNRQQTKLIAVVGRPAYFKRVGWENEMSRKLNYCEKGVSERLRAIWKVWRRIKEREGEKWARFKYWEGQDTNVAQRPPFALTSDVLEKSKTVTRHQIHSTAI